MKVTILISTLAAFSSLVSSVLGASAEKQFKQWIKPTSIWMISSAHPDKNYGPQTEVKVKNTNGDVIDSYISFNVKGYPGKTCRLEFASSKVRGKDGMKAGVILVDDGTDPKVWNGFGDMKQYMDLIRVKLYQPSSSMLVSWTDVVWGNVKPPAFGCPGENTNLTYRIVNLGAEYTDISWAGSTGLQLTVD